ncbi:MAG: HAD-IIIA family hydrolase [Deltaproteobacteria bacterium]|jgi:D-glycero-D-manno-heptose 1,7-bisphosphate phosphatase|nr:HAD-IIIA family hydrolase [Deltaproteobacteria bacterium]
MKVVIMAGGKGTRVASINSDVPKPMLQIAGKPVLEHQIDCLKRQSINDITLIIGHLGNVIKDKFSDNVSYIEEKEPLGTAGALYYLKNIIEDDFLLLNGDIIFDVDIERFRNFHKQHKGLATLLTHPNDHPYDSGVVVADKNNKVVQWLTKEDERGWYKNRVNAGLHMLSPKFLDRFTSIQKLDLDRDIFKTMIKENSLYAYNSPEYVKDIGSPDRFYIAEHDILTNKVQSKNLGTKQKAIFLDRDGTINKYVGFLTNIDEFELIDSTIDIIKYANNQCYLVIVVTNQPVIARGDLSWIQLTEIHNKMETLLGLKGAYIDDIFICPHHPDKGFEGERVEYKIDCFCRKPKPGMLLRAAEKYNIDLSQSYMLGDSEGDILAGSAAGCKSMFIKDFKINMLT